MISAAVSSRWPSNLRRPRKCERQTVSSPLRDDTPIISPTLRGTHICNSLARISFCVPLIFMANKKNSGHQALFTACHKQCATGLMRDRFKQSQFLRCPASLMNTETLLVSINKTKSFACTIKLSSVHISASNTSNSSLFVIFTQSSQAKIHIRQKGQEYI